VVKTEPFGLVLLLDGKMQSTEHDEWIYHEGLVHPAMLLHPGPRRVFICGGGEGATAREVLRHRSVEEVVMVDIDEVVCKYCEKHLPKNTAAFRDPRLRLVHDDARAQLEKQPDGSLDVIIGDLADPLEEGPCYQLYTQDFYETVVKRKLAPGGVFVTQSGPCGADSCTEVFTAIHNTLRQTFPRVIAFGLPIKSFVDSWGFNIALSDPEATPMPDADEWDRRMEERIDGELEYLEGAFLAGQFHMPKCVRKAMEAETFVYTQDNPRFLSSGKGIKGDAK